MSKSGRFVLLLGLAVVWIVAVPASGKGVDPAHRVCQADNDCTVLTIGCACLHNSTCASPRDQAEGSVEGVNKKSVPQYLELSKCSAAETKRCSMAGACPLRGSWVSKCVSKQCQLEFRSASNDGYR